MKPTTRTFLALTLLAAGSGAVSAQQTLTFTNTDTDPGTPVEPLSLSLVGGSSLSIAPNGNVNAQCVLAAPPSTLCAGISTGSGGPVPVVSLAATGLPATAPPYPAGTNFTITPTVTGADVCVRSVTINGAPATTTGWPGTATLPFFNAQSVSLPAASSTYVFSMRCYGAGGATTASLAPIATSDTPPPGGCAGFVSPLPSGWVRGATVSFGQVQAVEIGGATWNPFPNTGFTGYLITNSNQYLSLGFTTPTSEAEWSAAAPFKLFEWGPAQQQGEAVMSRVYISISSCAGDFRIPPVGQVAPANDTTFARGCRNIRPAFGFPTQIVQNIPYLISSVNTPSDDTTCRLTPGVSYHVNFIRANALDGSIGTPTEEAICEDGVSNRCGIQMRIH